MAQLTYLRNVVSLNLDGEKCVGCGTCLSVCPHAVLSLTNGRVEIRDRDACMECGACTQNCPVKAIQVRSGVGCAAAVINSLLGRKNASCCCTIDRDDEREGKTGCASMDKRSGCC
jgi:NAD-dependent dihydropyrimidine dehydrogenase PreA subunit